MIVAHRADELPRAERAVAIGTFDGVHRGHKAVIEAARSTGLRSTVVTFIRIPARCSATPFSS
jgi:FAD synthase